MNRERYAFQIGDRVRWTREGYYHGPLPIGTEGVVQPSFINRDGTGVLSRLTHATMNGGGYDIPVRLDDGRLVSARVEGTTEWVERVIPGVTKYVIWREVMEHIAVMAPDEETAELIASSEPVDQWTRDIKDVGVQS